MELRYASDYTSEQLERVQKTLLQVAYDLGDFIDDVVLAGGLVPMLLFDQSGAADDSITHIGSVDVDLGLHFAIVDETRYEELAERLSKSGFEPARNDDGNAKFQTWIHSDDDSVVIDFLVSTQNKEGTIFHLTKDLGAIQTTGLDLAFDDWVKRALVGRNLRGDNVNVEMKICGPAAFVVLKTLACKKRSKDKDPYDLAYVIAQHDEGPRALGRQLALRANHDAVKEAIEELSRNFTSETAVGPRRASRFLYGDRIDPDYVADFVGNAVLLLHGYSEGSNTNAS